MPVSSSLEMISLTSRESQTVQSAPTLVSWVTGYPILCYNYFVLHCWNCCCSIKIIPPRNQPRMAILFFMSLVLLLMFWFSGSSMNSSASWLLTCVGTELNPLLPVHGRGSGLSQQAHFYWPRTRSTSCHTGEGVGNSDPLLLCKSRLLFWVISTEKLHTVAWKGRIVEQGSFVAV